MKIFFVMHNLQQYFSIPSKLIAESMIAVSMIVESKKGAVGLKATITHVFMWNSAQGKSLIFVFQEFYASINHFGRETGH